jgi:hypothetical protein
MEVDAMKSTGMLVNALVVALTSVVTATGATLPGTVGDGNTSIYYVASTGEFGIQPDGWTIRIFEIRSSSGIFTADAIFPPGTLFDINTSTQKGWAAPANGIRKDFSLGVIAAPGLTLDFLLNDLRLSGPYCGCQTPILDLVYYAPGNMPPHGVDEEINFPAAGPGVTFTHQFAVTDAEDPASALVWSNLRFSLDGRRDPQFQPTLSPSGMFSWDTTGSPRGIYTATAIVTDSLGYRDMALLTINTTPEPSIVAVCGVAVIALASIRRRHNRT